MSGPTTDSPPEGVQGTGETTRSASFEARLAAGLPRLGGVARRLAIPGVDADDLLSEAVLRLLEVVAQGHEPPRNVEAYVIASMRNRLADEFRSPRWRLRSHEEVPDPGDDDSVAHDQTDLYRQFELVREAFARLPEDQRTVLWATVVEGRRPRELKDLLNRSAGAIHSLKYRAKESLQRALLQVMLEQDAEPQCREAAAELPKTLGPDAETPHMRQCHRCRRVWKQYWSIAAAIGISSVLLVGCASSATPVAAATAGATVAPGLRPRSRTTVSVTALVAGGAMIVAGLAGVGMGTAPQASVGVTISETAAGETGLVLAFDVNRPWRVRELRFDMPGSLSITDSPPGWSCSGGGWSAVVCTTGLDSPVGGTFGFGGVLPDQKAGFGMHLEATSGDFLITADISGQLAPR